MPKELANPYVVNFLEFYPHDTLGKDIVALYQSQKWREDLSKEFRVQMVFLNGKHFYIYEPVGLRGDDSQIVIPIFFYRKNGLLFSKCIKPKYSPKVATNEKNDEKDEPCRSFNILVPGLLPYDHQDLFEVPIADFNLLYSELQTYHGESFVGKAGYEIRGESCF